MTPAFLVEVITVPVSDVERALRFYADHVGFALDVDYAPTDAFREPARAAPSSAVRRAAASSSSSSPGDGSGSAPSGNAAVPAASPGCHTLTTSACSASSAEAFSIARLASIDPS